MRPRPSDDPVMNTRAIAAPPVVVPTKQGCDPEDLPALGVSICTGRSEPADPAPVQFVAGRYDIIGAKRPRGHLYPVGTSPSKSRLPPACHQAVRQGLARPLVRVANDPGCAESEPLLVRPNEIDITSATRAMIVKALHCLDGGRGTDSPPRHPRLTSPHRLLTDSTVRVTICLRIGAGVAKFSRANPVYSGPNVPPKFSPTLA
jgi:hypothetical protein